jgi:hypothetical protein
MKPFIDESLLIAVPEQDLQWALKSFFYTYKENNQKLVDARKEKLKGCHLGSFGFALNSYYMANPALPFPGSESSLFPQDYLLLHDTHHVLLGADVTEAGEVYVTAFECGLMSQSNARILTLLAQIQVLLDHKGISMFNAAVAQKAFDIGSQANPGLMDSFDPMSMLDEPLISIRQSLNIEPLSMVWG